MTPTDALCSLFFERDRELSLGRFHVPRVSDAERGQNKIRTFRPELKVLVASNFIL